MAIELNSVSLNFGEIQVIDALSATICEHRVGIIGANGSGKSTLARLITGLIEPSAGTIGVNGADIFKDRKAALDTIGIIFQNPDHQIIFPTCAEEIAFGLTQKGVSGKEADVQARAILASFDRADWADRLAHQLSQGQRHYLCLMAVLAMEPKIIVLDEPYAGLDMPTSLKLHRQLEALDQQLIMITHDPKVLAGFDRVIWMDQGAIHGDGAPADVLKAYEHEMQERANVRD